jgi:AcrR family transcriptional regulator
VKIPVMTQTKQAETVARRPLRADARRNRARLLAAAEQVIAEHGVSAPIDDIAHAAGVGIGTVYRHFPTKQALFEAIVHAHFEPLIKRAQSLLDADDPGQAFFDFIDTMVEVAGHKAIAQAIAESDPEVRKQQLQWRSQLTEGFSALLKRAQDAGTIRPDISYEDVRILTGGICMAHDRLETKPGQRERSVAILKAGLTATDCTLPALKN